MRTIHHVLIAAAVGVLTSCSSTSPYVYTYDPYYGYYPVAYDDYYYDAAMMSGYYYYPTVYYYAYRPQAASISVVPPAVRLLLQRWNATVDPACIAATTAGDKDMDGIDANSTLTFQCDGTTGGRTSTVTGAVTIKDLDDNAADAGYSITFNGFAVRVTESSGAVTARVVDGTESVAKSGNTLLLTRDGVVNATDTFPDGVQRQSKIEVKNQGSFTPEIVAPGTLVTRGTLTLSGQATFTGPDGVALTLTRQTDPTLHWNNDCTKVENNQGPIDSGAIVYRSSQGAQTRIVHESCTVTTVTNTR